jgi:hypothetical protein
MLVWSAIGADLINQLQEVSSPLYRIVPVKAQLGNTAQSQTFSQFITEETGGSQQPAQHLLLIFLTAHATYKYFGISQVGGGGNLGHSHKTAKPRVFDLALKQLANLLTDKIIHPLDAMCHNQCSLASLLSADKLQYIANLKVIKVLDTHPALIARGYLLDIILETPQAADHRFTYYFLAAPHPD